jgi:hypothetical protein
MTRAMFNYTDHFIEEQYALEHDSSSDKKSIAVTRILFINLASYEPKDHTR